MRYSWKIDDFDSKVFGFNATKITYLDSKNIKNLIRDLNKNKISYATIRVKANDFQLIHSLEQSGFILVDGLISLSIDVSSLKFKVSREVRDAKISDLLQLKRLTTSLYSNTRITNDPKTKAFANKYYTSWVENSVNGEAADSVLVWAPPRRGSAPEGRKGGEILGYVTLQKKGRRPGGASGPEGQVPLIGVSEKARGKGIGRSLLHASFARFKKWGVDNVNIDTQMSNIPALRAYQRVDFKIVGSYLTFRWAA